MKPVSNINFAKFITSMTKADALAPIVALEATVVGGRTLQAYKRGKGDEARERFLEEITGSIVWLWGVKVLNDVGDHILAKILKKPKVEFDVGTDKVLRKPFDNFMNKVAPKGFSPTKVAMLKGAKVLSSIILTNLFIGFVVPKVNHYITNTINHNKHLKPEPIENKNTDKEVNTSGNSSSPSFKGGLSALNSFTNIIENTNTGKLLSSDMGIAGGRMYNARGKEERREIAIRDLGSIYFYMWASGHVGNIMNYVESGRFTRLNPTGANSLDKYLREFLETKGNEMGTEEFKAAVLGKKPSEFKLPDGIKFEKENLSLFDKLINNFRKNKIEPLQTVKVSELKNIITDKELFQRISKMAELQPKILDEAVITKQQIIDAMNNSKINDPEFLKKVFEEFTGGSSSKDFKYVSNKKLYKYKQQMEEYVEDLCKNASNGKITKEVLDKAKKNNIKYSGINFIAGFLTAALFLSTLIPKFQYYVTRKTTGVNAFPGTYDYKNHQQIYA